jgi:hypothetical protein
MTKTPLERALNTAKEALDRHDTVCLHMQMCCNIDAELENLISVIEENMDIAEGEKS